MGNEFSVSEQRRHFEIDNVSHYPKVRDIVSVMPFRCNHNTAEGTLTVLGENMVWLAISDIEWKVTTVSTEDALDAGQIQQWLKKDLSREKGYINGVWLVDGIANDGRSYYLFREADDSMIVCLSVHLKRGTSEVEQIAD